MPKLTTRLAPLTLAAIFHLALCAGQAWAVDCPVIHPAPLSDADKALLSANYQKAFDLYQAALAAHPGDPDLTLGLVHALLRQQKVQPAADAVKAALAAAPNSAPLLTLRGEVELRQGEPWIAGQTINAAFKLDPCNPRTRLLAARLDRISSLYASALEQTLMAHRLAPDDPEIRREWIGTLSTRQRIQEIEAYLSSPTGDDPDDIRHLRMYLDHLKKQQEEPRKACHLVSAIPSTEVPFIRLMRDANHIRAYGLEVKLNDHSARLQIDTGAGGLLISRSVAQHAGLKAFSQTEMGGIGDQGSKAGYTAYADSIRIGNLEFADCPVRVLDSRNVMDDSDGLIGMDVFSQFLVTLDYPVRKLLLGPLPLRPGEAVVAKPVLETDSGAENDDEQATPPAAAPGTAQSDAQSDKAQANPASPAGPAGPAGPVQQPAPVAAKPHGPYNRYVAPEMKDYTPVYRVGHDLILPASLNGQAIKLFIMDTGAWSTTVSPQAAREVSKLHSSDTRVRGISGEVDKVYVTDDITFRFANLQQKAEGVYAFDTSHISRNTGLEISGFIGAATLKQLTIHIDYRDGLVKFDYDPKRGYRD